MKKSILALLLAGLMTISFSACGTDNASSNESSSETTTAAETTAETEAEQNTVADREGNEIEIPESINKIVSTSASNTEILVGLGLGDKIIAADTYSYDAGVDASVATLDMMNINVEQIVALEPDAVFVNAISMTDVQDPMTALKDAGINVLYIPSANSIDDIKEDIKFISAYTKTSDKGTELIENIDNTYNELKAIGDTVTEKKKVYFEVSAAPYCYSTGKGTYLNEILELVGAENVFADQEGWLSVTEESIIAANPDIILTSVSYEGYDYNEILARAGWDATTAVKNSAVYQVPTNPTSRASQNIVDGMKVIAEAIYPDLYK